MKLVCISDTHDYTDDIELPDGDVLIHAGDMTGMGTMNSLMRVNAWFGRLLKEKNYKKIIVTPGNHDWLFQKDPNLAKCLMTNCEVLIDQSYVFEGIKFYGSPRTPWFHDWAFNHQRGEDIKRFWDIIPTDTDVLITHGPPKGYGDEVRPGSAYSDSVGCEELLKAIERIKPKLHVFGHIHCGYGEYQYGSIKLVNASICTDWYNADHKPIVVDL